MTQLATCRGCRSALLLLALVGASRPVDAGESAASAEPWPLPRLSRPVRIAIYEGSGSSKAGIRNVERRAGMLAGAVIERLPAAEFSKRDLSEFDVIIFSGGSASVQARTLGDAGRTKVREYVRGGGSYLGICAGAYLACAGFDWGLQLIAAETLSDRWRRGVATVEMSLTPDGHRVFGPIETPLTVAYENGPVMGPRTVEGLAPYRTLAAFTTEVAENGTPAGIMIGSPAIAEARFGAGRVMIVSPHPERSPGLERIVPLAITRLTTAASSGEEQ